MCRESILSHVLARSGISHRSYLKMEIRWRICVCIAVALFNAIFIGSQSRSLQTSLTWYKVPLRQCLSTARAQALLANAWACWLSQAGYRTSGIKTSAQICFRKIRSSIHHTSDSTVMIQYTSTMIKKRWSSKTLPVFGGFPLPAWGSKSATMAPGFQCKEPTPGDIKGRVHLHVCLVEYMLVFWDAVQNWLTTSPNTYDMWIRSTKKDSVQTSGVKHVLSRIIMIWVLPPLRQTFWRILSSFQTAVAKASHWSTDTWRCGTTQQFPKYEGTPKCMLPEVAPSLGPFDLRGTKHVLWRSEVTDHATWT